MRHSFKEVDQTERREREQESIFSGLVLTYTARSPPPPPPPPRSPIIFALLLCPIIVSVRPLENIRGGGAKSRNVKGLEVGRA